MFRLLRWLLLALLLGLGALLLPEAQSEEDLERAAAQLRTTCTRQADVLRSLSLSVAADSTSRWDRSTTELIDQSRQGIEVMVWEADMLRYWTGTAALNRPSITGAGHVVGADGTYLVHVTNTGDRTVMAAQRIWYSPPFENRYLRKGFNPVLDTPAGLEAALGPGVGPVVRDGSDRVMFRLQWGDAGGAGMPWGRIVMLLLALAFLLRFLWLATEALAAQRGGWIAFLVLAAVLAGLRWISLLSGLSDLLGDLPLFNPALYAASFLLPSLGDLLVDAVLLLFLAAYAHRVLVHAQPLRSWWLIVGLGFAVLLGLAAAINQTLIGLVYDSSVDLDLYHLQHFDRYSVVALIAVALLLAAWSTLADGLVRWLTPSASVRDLLIALAGTFALALFVYHVAHVYDTVLVLWPAPLLVVLVVAHRTRLRMGHALLLIAALSVYTAHVFNRHTLKRGERDRYVLAEPASVHEDPVIELLYRDAAIGTRTDPQVLSWWDTDTLPCTAADLDRVVRQEQFTGYWDRYDVRLYLYSGSGQLRCTTSPDASPSLAQLTERFEQGVPATGQPRLRSVRRPGETALYLALITPASDTVRGSLYVELMPRLRSEGLGFPELLLAGDAPQQRRLASYARARYEHGALAECDGSYVYPIRWTRTVPPTGLRYAEGGFDHIAMGSPNGVVVVLGLKQPTWLDQITTFSYLFTFFVLLATTVLLIRTLVVNRGLPVLGLSGKLRTGVLFFAGLSLLLFALGTQRLLNSHYEDHTNELLEERTRSAGVELHDKLRGEAVLSGKMGPYLNHLLSKLSNVFFTDITLYAPEGALLATSRPQVFNTGLLAPRMDPEAFRRLAVAGASSFTHEERIGNARFRTAYAPFRNDRGEVLAYMALPYFARQGELEEERAAGVVAIVNLFVLLFVLSLVAAAVITNWTTRPLALLQRGLERIALGARNEPIPYQGRDELGALVDVYNRKVEELRASAERLAQSERESAWREMARQVAHEIKNPLTPMKLSIQLFQRSWDPTAPDAKEKLDKLSTGLVHQIDALSGVASAFSQFAQMPVADPEALDLKDVVRAAVDVFHATPGISIVLHEGPSLPVLADREHLLRVFNNLLKNAVQSIPEGREGRIDVRLQEETGHALATVTDNGSGIPASIHDRIFTPSFTTKSSGMGLGLAMVKRIVEQAGGSVRFESREGEGTTFFVSLPLGA
jgi:signal transduction histidine kinase